MRAVCLVLLAAITLSACDSTKNPLIAATYKCENGMPLAVVFNTKDQTATVTTDAVTGLVLSQVMSASGFHYANAEYGLLGKGKEAWWEIAGKIKTKCAS